MTFGRDGLFHTGEQSGNNRSGVAEQRTVGLAKVRLEKRILTAKRVWLLRKILQNVLPYLYTIIMLLIGCCCTLNGRV